MANVTMSDVSFCKIASQVLKKKIRSVGGSVEKEKCPDQYVGKISEFNSDQKDFPVRVLPECREKNNSCLIMILESPHTEEFKGDLGPAKGSTGRLIREWIASEDVGLSDYRDYGLILVNAIRNQCSLGVSTDCFRDDVFKAVWGDRGKSDFINRLQLYYQSGDAVVNCCIKGNDTKIELRKLVQQAIVDAKLDCVPLKRTHPSSWYKKVNRIFIWNQ